MRQTILERNGSAGEISMSAQPALQPVAVPSAQNANTGRSWLASNWGLLAAFAVLIVILLLPTPAGFPVAGHRMLAILGFAVISVLMAFLLGLAPSIDNPKGLLGTSGALTLAFSGFANTALVLVASALFLAAAMTVSGLDKRIALSILSRVGTKPITSSSASFWSASSSR